VPTGKPFGISTFDIALLGHLLGVIAFFSGMAVAAAALLAARRAHRAGEVAVLLGVTRIGVLLVGLGILVAVGFGFWLLSLTGYAIGDTWVSVALALLVASAVLGERGGKAPRRARELAAASPPDAPVSAELAALLRDRRADAANTAAALAAVAILVLMIWRPGS
jgi:uncharacterized membrane protein